MNLDEIYEPFVQYSAPGSVAALGWSSEEAQQKRFQVISEIGISIEDSILDVGCGYGDFSLFAGEKYLGIDMREHAIEVAEEKYKDKKFEIGDIFKTNEKFDWVVASGIFCFRRKDWCEYVQDTLKKMYELSNKGVAVNFLSGIHWFNDEKNKTARLEDGDDLTYAFPEDVMRLLREVTNNFTIRHDYGLNDFTVYLYK